MKICVVGAGAIGGLLGVRLANAGHQVSVLARGAHLAAIRERGLTLIDPAGDNLVARDLIASDDLAQLRAEAGAQDVVLLALKAHQIGAVVAQLPPLFAADGVLVTLQNGIPWWYFQNHGGAAQYADRTVSAVDPGGVLKRGIDPARILGCVAYPAALVAEPGVIRHVEGVRFPLGELTGDDTDRARRVSQEFTAAGFKSPVLPDIRAEIWLKLWGNLSFNPVSALSHATLEGICQYPPSRALIASMMTEAQRIAEKLDITFRVTLERRIDGAEKVGKHKTSMLQDVEAGKPLEIDGMLGAVIELADITQTEVPTLRAIHASVSLLNQTITQQRLAIRGGAVE